MDFFSAQDKRRASSMKILAAFVAILLVLALVLSYGVNYVRVLFGEISHDQLFSFDWMAFWLVGPIWLVILLPSIAVYVDLLDGGAALASRYRARAIKRGGETRFERRAVQLNEEISIAAQTKPAALFVLDQQHSINAFVIGSIRGRNPALVLTRGAMERLESEHLMAVIAHEYGHIVADDIPFNMHMLVALSGLESLRDYGRHLMRLNDDGHVYKFIVGIPIRIIGELVSFNAALLRAAFSREREFMADATAVQLTRSPSAVAGALATIESEVGADYALEMLHQQEILHLCLHSGSRRSWWQRFQDNHPPLQKRIEAIDAGYAARLYHRKRMAKKYGQDIETTEMGGNSNDKVASTSSLNGLALGLAAIDERFQSQEQANASHAEALEYFEAHSSGDSIEADATLSGQYGSVSITPIGGATLAWLQDEANCLATLFALFLPSHSGQRRDVNAAIAFAYNKRFAELVEHQASVLSSSLGDSRAGIIAHCCEVLKGRVDASLRRRMLKTLEQVAILAKPEEPWFAAATLHWIRLRLDADHPVLDLRADGGIAEPIDAPDESDFIHGCDVLFADAALQRTEEAIAEFEWMTALPQTARDAVMARILGQPLAERDGVVELCGAALGWQGQAKLLAA